jgi:hypothetical protein
MRGEIPHLQRDVRIGGVVEYLVQCKQAWVAEMICQVSINKVM